MSRIRSSMPAILTTLFFVAIFLIFFNGYKQRGPSRGKYKHLGSSEEEVQDLYVPEGEDKLIKELESNRKVGKWVAFWKVCMPDFTLSTMDDVGESEFENEPVNISQVNEERDGPGKMFYIGAPGGGKSINPWWRRLQYRKDAEGWQPLIELPCYALLYRKNEARIVLTCTMFEGMQDAIWLDKDRVALLGYESVSRQMDVRCKSKEESCSAPAIWVFDFAKGWLHAYRGKIIGRGHCDVMTYLKGRLPKFFGKEK